MIPLPQTYKKNGYLFEQVIREEDIAIYKQIDPDNGRQVAFEVFEIQKREAGEFKSKPYPAKELTPSNESWGKLGFTLHTILEAQAKAAILQERVRNRKFQPGVIGSGQIRKAV